MTVSDDEPSKWGTPRRLAAGLGDVTHPQPRAGWIPRQTLPDPKCGRVQNDIAITTTSPVVVLSARILIVKSSDRVRPVSDLQNDERGRIPDGLMT
jgi:hypothetical protein